MEVAFKLSVRAFCLYEEMTGKSYLDIDYENEITMLMYCGYAACKENPKVIYPTFLTMLENKKFMASVSKQCENILTFNAQLNYSKSDEAHSGETDDTKEVNITMKTIASSLIARYGLDPEYVMDKMELWEIEPYYDAIEKDREDKLERERLWTFFNMLPMAGKKLNSPDKLIEFPWEKGRKESAAQKRMERDMAAIKAIFGNKNKKEEENGSEIRNITGGQDPD